MGRMAVWGQPCRGQISADPISTKSWEWCILYREAQIGRLEYGSSLHQVQAQDTLLKKLRVNFLPWGEKLQGIFFLFVVLGFELRALHLLGRHSTTWAMQKVQLRNFLSLEIWRVCLVDIWGMVHNSFTKWMDSR
jgi:hypothetical protein